jgi:hypothetical protein
MIDKEHTEFIKPLIDRCRPMNVTVSLHCVKDKFYIHFDGTTTFKDKEDWMLYWGGFDIYAIGLLSSHKFMNNNIKKKSDTYIIAYIGTLFDFLKADQS